MILYPAIDLYEGHVVRLTEGDFKKKSYYALSPEEAARRYLDAGCTHIHIVDLEGAKTGHPCHLEVLQKISALGMFVQYGGGLRSEDHIRDALASGADRVMIGSLLFKDPDMPAHISSEFGPAAMPAIDIKHGRVVHSGWLEGTDITPQKAIGDLRGVGFSIFLVTDTERDGMMSGIRTEIYARLAGNGCDIVAAGGITTVKDLAALAEIGISGAVIGKSLYEGGIDLKDALDAVKQRELR